VLLAAWTWRNEVLSTPLDDGSDTEYLERITLESQAITAGTVVSADRAANLSDDELVIGVVIGTSVRAYPVRFVGIAEHVNDRIGDVPVCVTWCPATASGVVWDRRLAGYVLTFAYHPMTIERNLVLYDLRTKSIWSQLQGQALEGSLQGTELPSVPAVQTTWRHWRGMFPRTEVMLTSNSVERAFRYRTSGDNSRAQAADNGLHRFDLVLGFESAGFAKAYPLTELSSASVPVSDRIGEQTVQIHYDAKSNSAWATTEDGELLSAITAYWGAWKRFHSESEVFRVTADVAR
jgi:hypothetical protein